MDKEENYRRLCPGAPAVLPNGEVWEGHLKDGIFHPDFQVKDPCDVDNIMHVDEQGKPILAQKP